MVVRISVRKQRITGFHVLISYSFYEHCFYLIFIEFDPEGNSIETETTTSWSLPELDLTLSMVPEPTNTNMLV